MKLDLQRVQRLAAVCRVGTTSPVNNAFWTYINRVTLRLNRMVFYCVHAMNWNCERGHSFVSPEYVYLFQQ